jgi:hypothetical protein
MGRTMGARSWQRKRRSGNGGRSSSRVTRRHSRATEFSEVVSRSARRGLPEVGTTRRMVSAFAISQPGVVKHECGARARDAEKLAQAKRAIEDMLERRQAQSNS